MYLTKPALCVWYLGRKMSFNKRADIKTNTKTLKHQHQKSTATGQCLILRILFAVIFFILYEITVYHLIATYIFIICLYINDIITGNDNH